MLWLLLAGPGPGRLGAADDERFRKAEGLGWCDLVATLLEGVTESVREPREALLTAPFLAEVVPESSVAAGRLGTADVALAVCWPPGFVQVKPAVFGLPVPVTVTEGGCFPRMAPVGSLFFFNNLCATDLGSPAFFEALTVALRAVMLLLETVGGTSVLATAPFFAESVQLLWSLSVNTLIDFLPLLLLHEEENLLEFS